jgi:hypothetical protein
MNVDWSALVLVAIVSIATSAVTVALFATGIKLLAIPPAGAGGVTAARDDETDDVSEPSRPRAATTGGVIFFGLSAVVVLFGVYLIVPALHGG